MKKKIKIGYIGLGRRGMDVLRLCFSEMSDVEVKTLCDWMAIAPLSEMSIQRGGASVDIPDFTRGKWIRREPVVQSKYCLDEVIIDPDTPIIPK